MLITIKGNTVAELQKQLGVINQLFGQQAPLVERNTEAQTLAKEVMTPKRGRPPKAKIPEITNSFLDKEDVETEIETDSEEKSNIDMKQLKAATKETEVQFTQEQVVSALNEICDTVGTDVARNLLTRFECARVRDLKPSQYASFVTAAKAIVERSKL